MERIGRYEIVRELGRGAMSIVYEGFDGRIDRHLAIKVLRLKYARDVGARQRFLREARAAGGLAHPNIVTVFDVGQAEAAPYMVMELLPGGTLQHWLEQERSSELDIERLLELAIQLARGLAYAHQHGVIHRDIKPANIHYDPKTNIAKMMDFGIAATEDTAVAAESPEGIAGTLTHMAAELFAGGPADQRTDLYSLGVVFYQLLSGELPFSAETPETLVKQIRQHEIHPLKPFRADTPRELVDLTYRLMALEPESRPVSATQVADELGEIQDAIRSGIVHEVRRKSAAWRWPLLTGLGVALVLVLGLAHVYRSQTAAIAQTTFGFGDAMASLIAQETAEALILDDTTALSVLVSDFAANPEIRHLHISDAEGIVQASTDPYLRGERAPPPQGAVIERNSGSVRLNRSESGALVFRVPIRYQARRVGQVQLGLDGSGMGQTANATIWMLMAVFFAALLALSMGLVWMTRRQQLALKRLAWGLKRLQRGQFEYRLEHVRRDEFTTVFSQFNRLAVRLDELRRQAGRKKRAKSATSDTGLEFPPDFPVEDTLDLSRAGDADGSGDGTNAVTTNDDESEDDADSQPPGKVTVLRRQ